MFYSARNSLVVCGVATILCAANSLSAIAGMPIFNKSAEANIPSAPSSFQSIADNSSSDSTQYNPYAQDETNNLNQNPPTQVYYQGSGAGTAGYGAAAAAGAALNEANNRNNRTEGAAAAAHHHQTGNEHAGGEGHHGQGFGGEGRNMNGNRGGHGSHHRGHR